jgi:hypothetical protein
MTYILENLHDDILFPILELLISSELGKLQLSGCKALILKLSRLVRTFIHHPNLKAQHFCPKLISCFANLQTVNISLTLANSGVRDIVNTRIMHEFDISILPRTITTLNLNFGNALFCLLERSESGNGSFIFKDLKLLFPNLTSLSFDNDYFHKLKPNKNRKFWKNLPSLPLTVLHTPSSPGMRVSVVNNLNNNISELSVHLEIDELSDEGFFLKFPEHLVKLHVTNLPGGFPIQHLPRTLEDLYIRFESFNDVLISDELKDWPPKLRSLDLDTSNAIITQSLISRFPSTLHSLRMTHFNIARETSKLPSMIAALPRGLKTFLILPCNTLDAFPNELLSVSVVSHLPKTLTRTNRCFYKMGKLWKHMPPMIEVLEDNPEHHFEAGFVRAGNATFGHPSTRNYVCDLQPSIKKLFCDSTWMSGSLAHMNGLTHLIIGGIDMKSNHFEQISANLPLLQFLCIKEDLKDSSLLDLLNCSLTELDVACHPIKLNFGAKWAQKLVKLSTRRPYVAIFGVSAYLYEDENEDDYDLDIHGAFSRTEISFGETKLARTLQKIKESALQPNNLNNVDHTSVLRLPESLTDFHCEWRVDQLPTRREEWPSKLTSLSIHSTFLPLAPPHYWRVALPQNLIKLIIKTRPTVLGELYIGLTGLPRGLVHLELTVNLRLISPSKRYDLVPLVAQFAASRSRNLAICQVNDKNVIVNQEISFEQVQEMSFKTKTIEGGQ